MWDLVNNLGLKEGLQEFQEQFNKDAKQTIANTKFAKDRGLDVQRLDEIQENLQQQSQELHERTIGAAVDVLAKDDTIKQLFEIKGAAKEDDMAWSDSDPEPQPADAGGHEVATAPGPRAVASDIQATSDENPVAPSTAAVSSTATLARSCSPSSEPLSHPAGEAEPQTSSATTGAARVDRPTGATERPRADQRVRQLEAEVRKLTSANASAESQLSAAMGRAAELEARWAELSAVSDDALRQAEEAKQQVALLRHAVEQKDSHIAQSQDEHEQLVAERSRATRQLEDLESSFQERLQREVSQKEQELLEEVSYLRKANDTKERRMRDLGDEKSLLEKRLAARGGEAGSAGREAMLEAHTAIAKAFGDVGGDHPCVRLIDEPMLKFTAVLFKQALFRRVFFGLSAVMWIFALRHAIGPSTEHALHI